MSTPELDGPEFTGEDARAYSSMTGAARKEYFDGLTDTGKERAVNIDYKAAESEPRIKAEQEFSALQNRLNAFREELDLKGQAIIEEVKKNSPHPQDAHRFVIDTDQGDRYKFTR